MARAKGVPNRNYPPLHLKDARRVPHVMHDEASGMTVSRLTLAELLGTTPASSVFKELVAASRFYGLTEGGINSDEYSVTELGERAASADESVRNGALKEAVMKVAPFQTFFDAFVNRKVPGNAAFREFLIKSAGVGEPHVEACIAHILSDADEAGLTRMLSGAVYVDLKGVPRERTSEDEDGEGREEDDEAAELADILADRVNGAESARPGDGERTPPADEPEPGSKRPQAIFVAGRKGKSLDQLVTILNEYKIPHKLAEDEANRARPISTKVAETMRECGAAIIVFTPDEELRDLKGEPVFRPSQNVVHELGAAGMAYGNRIVIFREERVTLAANYSDIGHISFKDGELSAKAIELFRELIAFGLISVSVGS